MARRFSCLVKVGYVNGVLHGYNGFVTYKTVTNLLKFTAFLDREFPDWRFFNVYEKIKGQKKGRELGRFTKKNRPREAFLS